MTSQPIIAAIVVGLLMGTPAGAGEPLTILTGDTSGIYFPLGIGMGKLLSDGFPERTVQVQVSKGSVANLKLLADGNGEIGFAAADAIEAAKRGDAAAGFPTPLTNLRSIGALYPNYVQIVASAESGVRTLTDLKGKRLFIGAAQSEIDLSARKVLTAVGLDANDISATKEIGFSESVDQMKEGKLDATVQSAGLGVPSLNELSNTTEIVMIGIPPELVEKMGLPFVPARIPANTYKGQSEAVPSATLMNYLVTRADLPDEHVKHMTALIFERLDRLVELHRATRDMTLATATLSGPLPMHPGAAQYFRDKSLRQRGEADALNARGEARRAKGELAPALADFTEALRFDPEHRAAIDNRKALAREIERQGALMGRDRAR